MRIQASKNNHWVRQNEVGQMLTSKTLLYEKLKLGLELLVNLEIEDVRAHPDQFGDMGNVESMGFQTVEES